MSPMNKSMSLTTRLVVSMFIVPILMAVAIAFQGFRQSEDSKSRLDYFILTSVPSIELLERIRYTLAKHTATLNHAVLVYKEDKSVIDKLDELESAVDVLVEKFASEYVADDEDKRLSEQDKEQTERYMQTVAQTVELLKHGEIDKAKNLIALDGALVYADADQAIKKHVGYATKLAAKFQEEGKESAVNSMWIQLGTAAVAVLNFQDIIRTLGGEPRRAASAVRLMAQGDFSQPIQAQYPNSLIADLEAMRSSQNESIQKLHEAARSLLLYAESLASASHQVASGANNGSDNATRMAASAEEMTINISNVAESANIVSHKVSEAGDIAIRGAQSITELTRNMADFSANFHQSVSTTQQLGQQSGEIRSIVGEIKDIAEQTNILALNAAIEAARAGESGRGFAVVADEVRKLAERTKQSTEDIAGKIQSIQSNVQHVVGAMSKNLQDMAQSEALAAKANSAVEEIRSASENTVHLVADISAAIAVNSTTSKEVAKAVENFASLSEENSVAAKEVAITASELSKLADSLNQLTRSFKV
jgi:methyl-accepting chemotaxis protein